MPHYHHIDYDYQLSLLALRHARLPVTAIEAACQAAAASFLAIIHLPDYDTSLHFDEYNIDIDAITTLIAID